MYKIKYRWPGEQVWYWVSRDGVTKVGDRAGYFSLFDALGHIERICRVDARITTEMVEVLGNPTIKQ